PDAAARLWILDLPATRLAILTRVSDAADPDLAQQLEAIVNSIAIAQNAAHVTLPTPPPPPAPSEAPWPKIVVGKAMGEGAYYGLFSGYRFDADGRPSRLRSVGAAALLVPDGWYGLENGIASDRSSTPSAALTWWSIDRFNPDPCHWRDAGRPIVRGTDASVEAVARALTDGWPADGPEGQDRAGRPRVTRSLALPRFGYSYVIDLRIPEAAAQMACDDGEYRLWVDPEGRARTAAPGETIRLWVADVGGVLIVVDGGLRPGTPDATKAAFDEANDSLALFYPAPAP